MSGHKIGWLNRPGTKGETWNPIVGCCKTSPGCDNCYAEQMAGRLAAMGLDQYRDVIAADDPYYKHCHGWSGHVAFVDLAIDKPTHWRKPRTVFACSMGDLFHADVPFEWIDRVFAVMALCSQHTFIILTKRVWRMRSYVDHMMRLAGHLCDTDERSFGDRRWEQDEVFPPFPLPNVWLGVTAEDQRRADERIPHLLDTPAAVRFASVEPMLGGVDLYNGDPDPRLLGVVAKNTYLGDWWEPGEPPTQRPHHGLDWVICGGESGPGARPMRPDWARSLRGQCDAADVPFFFKQWGEWWPQEQGQYMAHPLTDGMCDAEFARVGKKAAGRLLDGVEHNAWPESPSYEATN